MKIIITMAGNGKRFKEVGYEIPKYQIKTKGKTMFEWSLNSLQNFFSEEFIFILQKQDDAKEFIEVNCKKMGINKYSIIELDDITDGQATTAMRACKLINSNESVLIFNIDTKINHSFLDFRFFENCECSIPVFQCERGEHWSFVLPDRQNLYVKEVTEKKRISNLASIGVYYFSKWEYFCQAYKNSYIEILEELGEVYIAPLYKYFIQQKLDVAYYIIPNDEISVLGTPEELQRFSIS